MNYKETIHYLYSQLPLFTRDGASAYKANLDNTIELLKRLDTPQYKFKSVHVGGTNGKGSTSHMLAAILQTAGYKTGLYTSPHLKDFRERIRINGQMISEQTVIDFVAVHAGDFDEIKPSFFEMTVALTFDVFAKEQVDIAIVEVGLGGRLDSTNVITPLLSIITNIGWDHMNILGDTLKLIAGEKAGIIKDKVPVVIGEYQEEVAGVFLEKAKETGSNITFASVLLQTNIKSRSATEAGLLEINISPLQGSGLKTQDLSLDLTGSYQLKNIKTVLCTVEELRSQGFKITDEHLRTALADVKDLTGLHNRWEVLNTQPLTICDTGQKPNNNKKKKQNNTTTPQKKQQKVLGMV